ncbi:MAG: hypothetical protein A2275_02200 [Bacteroidetes bacterium RIFOXYA12_FULL_35_11]|nr:MAG: hypothetical protein A2X01_12450 [Bacteroidetes bacterium GWF2_35_48]OFY72409.1 MAG: hypothetical protein A2275_02200 [Bacteroidetes bacterium RIFOXYA12_FULL_35_11]OFY92664.1 MAG: hypothetical protein A2491_03670 [Bacteroidetes bacterium RIFOXYC12_FULL_35_7]HBX53770.1 hypothetical protein [Bacteroidales bacterium]
MKTLVSSFIFFLAPLLLFSQAAGNYIINQSNASVNYKEKKVFDNVNYDGDFGGQSQSYYSYKNYAQPEKDTVIVLETNVLMNVKADAYIAIFGISQVSEKIENCHEMINNRISGFLNSLQTIGINTEETYIDFISQVPVFEMEVEKKLFSKTYNEIPKGFEVKKNIHIKYKDAKLAEKLLVEAAKNEIYDIVKVDYIVNNNEVVYDSLRSCAIKLMNKKVKEYKKLGLKFEPTYNSVVENISTTFPLERYSRYAAFTDPSMNVFSKSGKYGNSNRGISLFYNKLPYNEFDLVINPVVVDPVVQFAFKLKQKFVLKKQ